MSVVSRTCSCIFALAAALCSALTRDSASEPARSLLADVLIVVGHLFRQVPGLRFQHGLGCSDLGVAGYPCTLGKELLDRS
jgi:hypothetical protein